MDETGFCQYAAIANLAHRARVPIRAAEKAIEILSNPDINSGDQENEGRRIERVPGGWVVLNAEKYRAIVTRAVSQEATRKRVARFRAKHSEVTACNGEVTHGNDSVTPSEAEANTEALTPKPPFDGKSEKQRQADEDQLAIFREAKARNAPIWQTAIREKMWVVEALEREAVN